MFQTEHLQEKWAPVLAHPDLPKIEDSYKRAVTTLILENQEKVQAEEGKVLTEALQTTGYTTADTATGATAGFDPVLISLIRRSMPQLIAYDIAGVQPMTGPTGLIFAMRTNYGSERRPANSDFREAMFNEPNAGFSGEREKDCQTTILLLLLLVLTMLKVLTLDFLMIPLLEHMKQLVMLLV